MSNVPEIEVIHVNARVAEPIDIESAAYVDAASLDATRAYCKRAYASGVRFKTLVVSEDWTNNYNKADDTLRLSFNSLIVKLGITNVVEAERFKALRETARVAGG